MAGDPSDSSHSWAWRAAAAAAAQTDCAAGCELLSCLVSSHLAMNEREREVTKPRAAGSGYSQTEEASAH